MALDLERTGYILANYSAMVFVSTFVFSLIGMFAGLNIPGIGPLSILGVLGYFVGSIGYFIYRRSRYQMTAKYNQQVEVIGLIGSLLLSPIVGILVGGLVYLIGKMG